MSSAAVMAVYTAGYLRTKAAAEKFDEAPARRRPNPIIAETPASALVPGAIALPSQPEPAAAAPRPEPIAAAPPDAPAEPRAQAPTTTIAAPATPAFAKATAGEPAQTAPSDPSTLAPAFAKATAGEPSDPSTVAPSHLAPSHLEAPAKPTYRDGSYLSWGYSRHGNLQVQVVIADGKIASANIFTCLTRYPCSMIEMLPKQAVARQSAEVDFVSGATESGDAYYYAISTALKQAQ